MEENNNPQSTSEILPHLRTKDEVLLSITRTFQEMRASSDASGKAYRAGHDLVVSLYRKAKELDASAYEIARAALKGIPRALQEEYFDEIEQNNIFGPPDKISMMPSDVLALAKEFSLRQFSETDTTEKVS